MYGNNTYKVTSAFGQFNWYIDDFGGTDYLDLSIYNTNLTIDIRYGGVSTLGIGQAITMSKNWYSVIENVSGGQGNDWIAGNQANNRIWAQGGNDLIFALGGNDMVAGGFGSDTMRGGDGSDTLYGEEMNDYLLGDEGNDVLFGGGRTGFSRRRRRA